MHAFPTPRVATSVTKKRAPLSAGEVATYIKLGRQRVVGSVFDPYLKCKDATPRILKDAMTIAQWFNANRRVWDDQTYHRLLKDIRDIQYGPSLYWKNYLQTRVHESVFKAAESWAQRHKVGNFVDMALSCTARDEVFAVLDKKMKLRHALDPYLAMLDVLRFVFHGLTADDPDNGLEL